MTDNPVKFLGSYDNGTYKVYMWSDGTKIREAENDVFDANRPECIDVGISTKCNSGCPFCYMGCSKDGSWADFDKYNFLNDLPKLLEVNINLNSPFNPDLNSFLERMKQQNVIVNGTIRDADLIENYDTIKDLIDRKLIYGLGVSISTMPDGIIDTIKAIPNAVVHVIAGIFNQETYDKLASNGLKLLILGYKDIGRGNDYFKSNTISIQYRIDWLRKKLISGVTDDYEVVAFDNLAIKQLDVKSIVDDKTWEEAYLGEDSLTSFYIDLVNNFYAPNSLSSDHRPIGDKSLREMFVDVKGCIE